MSFRDLLSLEILNENRTVFVGVLVTLVGHWTVLHQ